MFALPTNTDQPNAMDLPECPQPSKVQYQHPTGKTIELIGRSKQSILDKILKFHDELVPPAWDGRDTIGRQIPTKDIDDHPLSIKEGIPLYMRRFDFTVCCVAFTVNEVLPTPRCYPYLLFFFTS